MGLTLITAPAAEPVELEELKNSCRVDADLTEDDWLIAALGLAARRWVEQTLRRALVTQTWELWLDTWPAEGRFEIPRPPLQSVTSIKYYGTDNTAYTVSASTYFVDVVSQPGRVVLADGQSWPSLSLRPVNAVVVKFVAGYGDAPFEVPETIRQALRLLVAHWYENREAVIGSGAVPKEIPFGVEALLWPERCLGW